MTFGMVGKMARLAGVVGLITVLWGAASALAQGRDRSASRQVSEAEVQAALEKAFAAFDYLSPGSKSLEALRLADEALEVLVKPGAWPGQGVARLVRGGALYYLARPAEAVPELEAAARMLDVPELEGPRALALRTLGNAQCMLGNLEAAGRALDGALELYRKVGDSLGEANALESQGEVASLQQRLGDALQKYDTALALYRRQGESQGEADSLKGQGDVLRKLGRMGEALEKYDAALSLYRKLGESQGEANTMRSWGDVLNQTGRMGEALEKYDAALVLYRNVGNLQGEANILMRQGDVLTCQGRLDEALEKLDAALDLHRKIGGPQGEANTVRGQGDVLLLQGRLEDALVKYDTALDLYRRAGDPQGEASMEKSRGDVLTHLGKLGKAQRAYERALGGYSQVGDIGGRANGHASLAVLFLQMKEDERVWPQITAYFSTSEDVLGGFGSSDIQVGHAEDMSNTVNDFLEFGIALHHAPETWEHAQFLHGRGIRLELATARVLALHPERVDSDATALRATARTLRQQLSADMAILVSYGASCEEKAVAAEDLRAMQQELATTETLLLARLGLSEDEVRPARVAEIQAALARDPRDPVLLEYYQRGETLLVFVIDAHAITARRLFTGPPPEGVPEDATTAGPPGMGQVPLTLQKVLDPLRQATTAGPDHVGTTLRGLMPSDANTLYELLLAPIAERLGCTEATLEHACARPLYVVPDGILHWVPFSALATSLELPPPEVEAPHQWEWMITHTPWLGMLRPISVLPNAALLLERFQVPLRPGGGVVAMGDPAGAGFEGKDRPEVRAAGTLVDTCPDCSRDVFNGGFFGTEATEARLRSALGGARFLHISSHGAAETYDPEGANVELSYLILGDALLVRQGERSSGPKGVREPATEVKGLRWARGKDGEVIGVERGSVSDSSLDGLVFPPDLAGEGIHLETVVLSSCVSALGEYRTTEGFDGVSRALLSGGVTVVLSSQWPVSVAETTQFMEGFYAARTGKGEAGQGARGTGLVPWNEAVLEAARSLRGQTMEKDKSIPLEHPFFWAGFPLYGTGLEREEVR